MDKNFFISSFLVVKIEIIEQKHQHLPLVMDVSKHSFLFPAAKMNTLIVSVVYTIDSFTSHHDVICGRDTEGLSLDLFNSLISGTFNHQIDVYINLICMAAL